MKKSLSQEMIRDIILGRVRGCEETKLWLNGVTGEVIISVKKSFPFTGMTKRGSLE